MSRKCFRNAPERYLSRPPLHIYSKQSILVCASTTITFPFGCFIISPFDSAQYPRSCITFWCLISIRKEASFSKDGWSPARIISLNFLTAIIEPHRRMPFIELMSDPFINYCFQHLKIDWSEKNQSYLVNHSVATPAEFLHNAKITCDQFQEV